MQHTHFDLDQTEAAIRRMFAEVRAQPKPADMDEGALFVAGWQDRSEDLIVAFMRLALTMENEGTHPSKQGYVLGVILADCASQYLSAFDGSDAKPLQSIMTGFGNHLNQCMQQHREGGDFAGSVQLVQTPSGRA